MSGDFGGRAALDWMHDINDALRGKMKAEIQASFAKAETQNLRELLAEALPFVEEAAVEEQDAVKRYSRYPDLRRKYELRANEIMALAERVRAAIPKEKT